MAGDWKKSRDFNIWLTKHWVSGYVFLLPWEKRHIHRKRKPSIITYCILHSYKLSSQCNTWTCTTKSNFILLSPSSNTTNPHPPTSWARSSTASTVWDHPQALQVKQCATGTHRNKMLLVGGLKVTHFCRVMANVQISSMLPYIRRWKFLFPPESGSEPMMTRTAWPLCAPAPVPDCSYCEILIELARISLAVTCAPCLSLTQCLCEKDLDCFFLSPPIW